MWMLAILIVLLGNRDTKVVPNSKLCVLDDESKYIKLAISYTNNTIYCTIMSNDINILMMGNQRFPTKEPLFNDMFSNNL